MTTTDKTPPADHLIVAGTTTIHDVMRMSIDEFEAFIQGKGSHLTTADIHNLDDLRRKFAAHSKAEKDKQDAALGPGALDPNGIYAERIAKKTAAQKATGNENRPLDHASIYAARGSRK